MHFYQENEYNTRYTEHEDIHLTLSWLRLDLSTRSTSGGSGKVKRDITQDSLWCFNGHLQAFLPHLSEYRMAQNFRGVKFSRISRI